MKRLFYQRSFTLSTKCFHIRCLISCTLRYVDGVSYLEAIIPIPNLLILASVHIIILSRKSANAQMQAVDRAFHQMFSTQQCASYYVRRYTAGAWHTSNMAAVRYLL